MQQKTKISWQNLTLFGLKISVYVKWLSQKLLRRVSESAYLHLYYSWEMQSFIFWEFGESQQIKRLRRVGHWLFPSSGVSKQIKRNVALANSFRINAMVLFVGWSAAMPPKQICCSRFYFSIIELISIVNFCVAQRNHRCIFSVELVELHCRWDLANILFKFKSPSICKHSFQTAFSPNILDIWFHHSFYIGISTWTKVIHPKWTKKTNMRKKVIHDAFISPLFFVQFL